MFVLARLLPRQLAAACGLDVANCPLRPQLLGGGRAHAATRIWEVTDGSRLCGNRRERRQQIAFSARCCAAPLSSFSLCASLLVLSLKKEEREENKESRPPNDSPASASRIWFDNFETSSPRVFEFKSSSLPHAHRAPSSVPTSVLKQ